MSLVRIARLALLSQQQQQASACLALQQLLPAAAGAQHRLYQAASVAHASSTDAGADDQADASQQYRRAAAGRPQELSWSPQRSLPPASHYAVKVTVKAHDLKFLKLASTVIRDLLLVHFAPKSSEVLPPGWKKGDTGVPYVKLAMPIGDAAVPTKRKHWTVIRGPHVHKTSREQFARITQTRVITYATNNASELAWFLDSLKLYKFIGVELLVKVTSSSHLLPTTAAQQAAADTPLLATHKQRFAHLFGAAAPADPQQQQQQQEADSSSYAALQQSLQGLRQSMHQQLMQQRLKLSGVQNYGRWQETADGRQAAAAAAAAAGGPLSALPQSAAAAEMPGRQLADAVAQQLQGSNMVAAADAAAAESSGDGQQQQQQLALAAAIDKAMLQLKLDVLDRHKLFPYLMAFYQPGQQQLPAAEWMHAMLKYGKVRQAEVASSQAAAGLTAYQQLGQANHALLLLLLQQWHGAADAASRRELALPDEQRLQTMLPADNKGSADS
uniref:Small ribosomal subunit protein uS10 domain-containing protein n=1 Tax=Tetradesmus obliquus TaxID=3088 RepID=A0A383VHB8_TETOB